MKEKTQSLLEHMEELRKSLIAVIAVFVISLVAGLFVIDRLYRFFIIPLDGKRLTVLGPADVVHVYFMLAAFAAIAITLPYAMYRVWKFVSPGLTEQESKLTLLYIPGVSAVFLLGICFGYFIVFRMLLDFLYKLSAANFDQLYTASAYFKFLVNSVVPFGFIFEMPIIVMFLTRLGLLTPKLLSRNRKYAYFGIVVVAAMITPPDVLSHIGVTLPIVLLYELSVQISKWAFSRKLSRETHRSADSSASVDSV